MKKIVIVLLSVIFIICSSCGNSDIVYENQNEGEMDVMSNNKLAEGVEMPNLSIETNKDKIFDLSTTDKPALINFWATWCPPCRSEMPSLQNLYEEYGNKVDFILVNIGENKETVQDFLVENEFFTFPVAFDSDGVYAKNYNVLSIPTTFIVGKDKKIKNYIIGARPEDQFREYIENVINE